MDQTVPITIESKGTATPSDKTNEWDYTFFLNVEPDVTWISLFRKHFSLHHFSLHQNVAPMFRGKIMTLTCIPTNLANRYQAVKQAVEKANPEYVEVMKASGKPGKGASRTTVGRGRKGEICGTN